MATRFNNPYPADFTFVCPTELGDPTLRLSRKLHSLPNATVIQGDGRRVSGLVYKERSSGAPLSVAA
jgi:hypothetical protein